MSAMIDGFWFEMGRAIFWLIVGAFAVAMALAYSTWNDD